MPHRDARTVGTSSAQVEVSLRIAHPSLDPRLITAALSIRPDFSYMVGERRRTPRGALLDGVRKDSAWLVSVASGPAADLRGALLDLAARLAPARAFLHEVRAGQGNAVLWMGCSFAVLAPLELGHEVLHRLGELGLDLVLDLYSGDDRAGQA